MVMQIMLAIYFPIYFPIIDDKDFVAAVNCIDKAAT